METKSLYISSLEPSAGSLIVTMGLMELLKRKLGNVAFFRPIIADSEEKDHDIDFVLEKYDLDMRYSQSYGYTVHEVETMIADNRLNELIESLIVQFKALEKNYDFVLIEGLNQASFTQSLDFDINLIIAKNIGSPLAVVLKGKDKSLKEVVDEIAIETDVIKNAGCSHFANFVNRVDEKVLNELSKIKQIIPTYYLPEVPELDTPTVNEIMNKLNCMLVLGEQKDLKRVVKHSKIAAMKLENFLEHIEDGDLIIVPGDRADIVVGAIATVQSRNHPNIACLLLTGGMTPSKVIKDLFTGYNEFPMPILSVNEDTYQTAVRVSDVPATINVNSERKIALAMGLFSKNVDVKNIEEKITSVSSSTITPMMFEYGLFERARSNRKKIVLPESNDERILRATEILLRRNVVDIVLLGDKDEIEHKVASLGLDLSNVEIINPQKSELTNIFINEFYELRRKKGLTLEAAKDAMTHVSYFGTMMVHMGYADGMVSGAIHTTGDTIRPALQIIKTKPGISTVSSLFFMCLDTKVLVYGDCAVNQDPNANELAQIAISSADTAKMFGIDPKVAMLSYSTGSSGHGEDVEKVREATKVVIEKRPDILIEGPIQYDAAIDEKVGKKKLPNSEIAGKANIFIFPDLNTGNNTYKAVQRSSNAVAIGPVLQGLNKPVNDLSRGCLVADIINTVAITVIQAQENNKG
ncbi:phosphate acetyltransferase [Sulfurospirillum arcachonense]|uniref:phosphate acetyltransferase n=1 Tax=Sulfurospirillum arcachonense TaxID=57666 RepID=UPI00046A7EC2|nr:phosphate acetyltransferase [Sulfurospirillum arcachonense]